MNALIVSSNKKIYTMLCNKLNNYCDYNFHYIFKNGTEHHLNTSEINYADIIFISVCGGENYHHFLEQFDYSDSVTFLIGDDEKHAVLVYQYRFDGFINVKNFNDDIEFCMDNFALLSRRRIRINAVTFGRFNIFVDEAVVNFHSVKSKELLALCIDRQGGEVTMDEAVNKLWPDRSFDDNVKKLYRKAVMMLNKVLNNIGVPDVFVPRRGSCYIKKDRFECDYFRFRENIDEHFHLFNDEYMFDYTWAESTLVNLQEIKNNYLLKLRNH